MTNLKLSATLMALTLLMISSRTRATVYYSRGSGSWTTSYYWSTVGCGGAAASSYPNSPSDVVYICSGSNISMPAGASITVASIDITGSLVFYPASTPAVLTIAGNLTINSGGNLRQAANYPSTTSIVRIGGNFINNGTFDGYIPTTYTGRMNINMNGTGAQTISGTPTLFEFSSLTISNTGGIVSTTTNFSIATGATMTVNSSARFYCGASVISGAGSFTLASGGTLGIGSPDGITSSGTAGNIQLSGSRSYSTGASYVYNGTNSQNTGSGLPSTVNNLTFNNTGGAVYFGATCTITNNFSITTGSMANLYTYTHTANTMTLGGVGTVSGSWGSTSSPAEHQNNTYFAATGGIVNVTTGTYNPLTFNYIATNITCYGANDGRITITASGGSGSGYQYRIYNGAVWIGWQGSNVFQGLPPATYTIEVKDGNGVVQTGCP